ncbi:MAG TPA: DUF6599 family protein [Myxococcota bacterium]|nr:DUF6599 family protein [Myxococcota bacterium]
MRPISVFLLISFLAIPAGAGGQANKLFAYLPAELVTGVTACGKPEHFIGKKLFDYMDGGAELYLAYGFSDIGVRNYSQAAVKLTVEIYRLGSPADAFGAFSHRSKGKAVEIGIPAVLANGMLSFFKGRLYVRLVAKSDPTGAAEVLVAAGKSLAAKLPGKSEPPADIAHLPAGAVGGSLRYLPNPQTARTVWFDGEGDILLSRDARAVTAFYAAGDNDIQLTRVIYPTPQAAQAACQALVKKLEMNAVNDSHACDAGGKTSDDVYAAMAVEGGVLRLSSGCGDLKTARAWMAKIK